MEVKRTKIGANKTIVKYDHYVCIPHTFGSDAKAGDIVENLGVVWQPVDYENDPNGAVMIHGFVDITKIEESQKPTSAQVTALPMIKWVNADGTIFAGSDA